MKKILIWLLFSSVIVGQSVTVIQIKQLNKKSSGAFYFPQFSPDGSKVLVTSENFKGLSYIDIKTGKIKRINNYQGAGYKPVFLPDNSGVVFKSYQFVNGRKYSSLIIQNFAEKGIKVLESNQRILSPPKIVNGQIFFRISNRNKIFSISKEKHTESIKNNEPVVYIKNSKIILLKNGIEKTIAPFGDGIYVWASLSPDKEKLLFTYGSKGSFVTDLDGKILVKLGNIHAPRWSPDGKWIVCMNDKDNGVRYLSSDIYVFSSNGSKKFQITNTKDKIEMYPRWSPDGKNLVFHTLNGIIYEARLKITEK